MKVLYVCLKEVHIQITRLSTQISVSQIVWLNGVEEHFMVQ